MTGRNYEKGTNFYWFGRTVRPPLSGHVGTGAHPDKGFVRIWETQCLLHVAADPMVAAAMLRLVVLSVQLDQNCRTYFISK